MTANPRPNILWICTDQQRPDSLGCYGNRLVATPNIDRLAAEGTTLDAAFCQCPVCTPSRASFLTGRYPRTCRTRQNGVDIPADEILVTRLLANAGYACGLSGKLHISAANIATGRISERRINDGYGVFRWSHHPYRQWGTPANEYQLDLRARGLDYRRESHPCSRFVETSMPRDQHHSGWCADQAMAFMEECANEGQPWLFSCNFFDPHHPFDPPPELMDKWLNRLDEVPLPSYCEGELANKPVFQRMDAGIEPGGRKAVYAREKMTDTDHRMIRAAYWAMVECIDHHVGRMMEKLQELGMEENTLVIFMSDHGEMLGDHGIYEKGPYLYDALMRVPLIFRQPGTIAAGRRIDELIELVDLAPTLLNYAELDIHPAMQGKSFLPWVAEGDPPEEPHREDLYGEFYHAMMKHQNPPAYLTMLRTRSHKLVVNHGQGDGEFYDLIADPEESRNLWGTGEQQTIKVDLMHRLLDRMAFTADPMPARLAEW